MWCWLLRWWLAWIWQCDDLLSADGAALVGDELLLFVWSAGWAFGLGHHDHTEAVSGLGALECVAESLVPDCSNRLLLVLVHAVWFLTHAAAADRVLEILVEQFLALLLAVLFGQLADLRALFTALDAVALHAFADVPALSVAVGDVSFLASAHSAFDALLAVPYLVHWAGAAWVAVGLVADVGVLVAGAFAWAGLEGTAGSADDFWCASLLGHLLHAFVCADHVCTVYAWDINLL